MHFWLAHLRTVCSVADLFTLLSTWTSSQTVHVTVTVYLSFSSYSVLCKHLPSVPCCLHCSKTVGPVASLAAMLVCVILRSHVCVIEVCTNGQNCNLPPCCLWHCRLQHLSHSLKDAKLRGLFSWLVEPIFQHPLCSVYHSHASSHACHLSHQQNTMRVAWSKTTIKLHRLAIAATRRLIQMRWLWRSTEGTSSFIGSSCPKC